MEILFEKAFERDLKKLDNREILSKLKHVILQIKHAKKLSEIAGLQKLKGYESFYRIKIGNYRIGIEIVSGKIIFTRFLDRKEIYRHFP